MRFVKSLDGADIKGENLKRSDEVLDYLRNRTQPSCVISPEVSGHVLVRCGQCAVTVPADQGLTTTTLNEIERRLEPCLGQNWMP